MYLGTIYRISNVTIPSLQRKHYHNASPPYNAQCIYTVKSRPEQARRNLYHLSPDTTSREGLQALLSAHDQATFNQVFSEHLRYSGPGHHLLECKMCKEYDFGG
jgi:hypothetical protein